MGRVGRTSRQSVGLSSNGTHETAQRGGGLLDLNFVFAVRRFVEVRQATSNMQTVVDLGQRSLRDVQKMQTLTPMSS